MKKRKDRSATVKRRERARPFSANVALLHLRRIRELAQRQCPEASELRHAIEEALADVRADADIDVRIEEMHEENERLKAAFVGERGGKAGGYKGGRPSRKPLRVELQEAYNNLSPCGSKRDARAQLVKKLQDTHQVSPSTARAWLRDAGI